MLKEKKIKKLNKSKTGPITTAGGKIPKQLKRKLTKEEKEKAKKKAIFKLLGDLKVEAFSGLESRMEKVSLIMNRIYSIF